MWTLRRRAFLTGVAGIRALHGQAAVPGLVEVRVVDRLPPMTSILNQAEVPLARKLQLAAAASGSAEGEDARAVLAGAIEDMRSLVANPVPDPSRVAVLTDGGEDVLVAQWSGGGMEDTTPVLLWDDSISETVVFACRPDQIHSAEILERRVHGLLNWSTHRLGSAGLCVRRVAGPGAMLVGYGYRGANSIPSPFARGVEVTFSGLLRGNVGYLSISFVSNPRYFPREMKEIDERFPRLRQRLLTWPTTSVLRAIGGARRARYLVFGAYRRDGILVAELAGRSDLSIAAFLDLLSRGAGNRPSMAGDVLPEMIHAAMEARSVGRFAPAIEQFLDENIAKRTKLYQVDLILSALRAEKAIDLEDRAVHYLGRKLAVTGCLQYLEIHGKTKQAYDAVASLEGDGQWADLRKAALAAIAGRIQGLKQVC